ncbi:DUF3307 domain-containing protein [Marinovum sp.]|uniref:DUF3307 domain-containing protein n=1 Tax=Marinovum sp. TaxID=2024839 RepID=UPI002B26FC3C|nr:DUF3307 domain-containing protein [Marinovum sp.]
MSGEAQWLLLLLLGFQAKHLAADYLLQTPFMLSGKGRYGHPGGLLHATIHGGFSAGLLALAGLGAGAITALALAETVLHYHLDWGKERWLRRRGLTTAAPQFWMALGVDQFLHQLTYLALAALALGLSA